MSLGLYFLLMGTIIKIMKFLSHLESCFVTQRGYTDSSTMSKHRKHGTEMISGFILQELMTPIIQELSASGLSVQSQPFYETQLQDPL